MSEWQPIETAPEGKIVVVGWYGKDDGEPRMDFDFFEDGVWVRHHDSYEHFSVAAAPGFICIGPSEAAPYTLWLDLPEFLK